MKSLAKKVIKQALYTAAAATGRHRWPTQQGNLWILMYHRILPDHDPRFSSEEPGMVVSPKSFENHLKIINKHFSVVQLSDWMDRKNLGKSLPPKACAITFDDGWLDNFQYALPLLRQYNMPATVFVVADMIGTNRIFWPNRIIKLFQQKNELDSNSRLAKWLKQQSDIHLSSNASTENIAKIIDCCKKQPDNWITKALDELEAPDSNRQDPVLMNWQQLSEMVNSGLIEIGSHTCNHFRLNSSLSAEKTVEEITRSKEVIQKHLLTAPKLFCYPNGDTSTLAKATVAKHYLGAVTTNMGTNNANNHSFRDHTLNRIGVHEDVSNTTIKFEARLSGFKL